MKSLFAIACFAAVSDAYISNGKAAFLATKGVNMVGLHERHDKVAARSAHKKLAVTRNATKLRVAHQAKMLAQQFDDYGNEIANDESEEDFKENESTGDDTPIFNTEENAKSPDYYENMAYGVIDGLTADFDMTCAESMYAVVNGGARALQYKNVANPTNTIKFQMATNELTEGANSVYAFCDFTHFYTQIAMLTDFSDPTQFIQLGSRWSGTLIQSVPKNLKCIKQGQLGLNGYDVGICGGGIVSLFLDTQL